MTAMELSVHHIDGPQGLNRVYGPRTFPLPPPGAVATQLWVPGAHVNPDGMRVTFLDFGPFDDEGWSAGRMRLQFDDGLEVGTDRPCLFYGLPCDMPMHVLFASPYYGRWVVAMRSTMTLQGVTAMQRAGEPDSRELSQ